MFGFLECFSLEQKARGLAARCTRASYYDLTCSSHLEIDTSRHEVRADEDPNLTSPEALNDIITPILQRCK